MEIQINHPYEFAGQKAVKAVIQPINYAGMAVLATEAAREATEQDSTAVILRRKLIYKLATIVTSDGKSHAIDPLSLMTMPRPVAMPIVRFIDTDGDVPEGATPEERKALIATGASIIADGDGMTAPILLKLGSPIKGADGKAISEVEIQAKTYGDIEHVLSGSNDMEKTVALITKCFKPAGMLALPSWGVEAVSLRDGYFIQNNILQRFLD